MSGTKVGVVGLGNMGGGGARNFSKAGIPLMVWDVAQAACAPFHETRTGARLVPGAKRPGWARALPAGGSCRNGRRLIRFSRRPCQ